MADPSTKAASFLASLKSGPRPGGLGAGVSAGGAVPEELFRPMQRRIDELEKRVQEALKAAAGPDEGEPPRPPTELMMYIHARTELLERKLQEAQAEALRANLLLHEREAAQRKAQKEVEDLFRTIKDQQRAASYDAGLREQVSSAQRRIAELEARLGQAELGAIPAEQVLAAFKDADAAEALRREAEERVRRAQGGPPAAPNEAQRADALHPSVDSGTLLVLTARISDLERELEAARRERDEERGRRAKWERETAASFAQARERWKRPAGVDITVEAALETMTLALREREEVEAELKGALEQAQAEPPGAPVDPVVRARITGAQERLEALQKTLDQQLNLVQAWIEQSRREG